jgi:ABC-type transport system involved in multi-copper enzyme maturation permease subunit
VVLRELQSASRQRGIYKSRYIGGIASILCGAVAVYSATVFPGAYLPGRALFWVVSGVAAILCISAGFLLTCDSISKEKREGTLGLLFLTSLGFHEIVLGKMAASSIFAASGVIASIPALAVSICLGGVTGSQFWLMALALLNALFLSLALGLFFSSVTRKERTSGALFILGFLATMIGGLVLFWRSKFSAAPAILVWHPIYPIIEASGSVPSWAGNHFWPTIRWNLFATVLLLYLASFSARVALLRTTGAISIKAPWSGRKSRAKPGKVGSSPLLWLQGLDESKELFFWSMAGLVLFAWWVNRSSTLKISDWIGIFGLRYLLVFLFAWKASNLMAD